MMRIKGGKNREQLVNAVLRGDIQVSELPSSVRGSVEAKVAKIKADEAAKAEAEQKAKAQAAKPKPKPKAKTSGKISKTGVKVSSKPKTKAGKK
jgi:hypothetical protein